MKAQGVEARECWLAVARPKSLGVQVWGWRWPRRGEAGNLKLQRARTEEPGIKPVWTARGWGLGNN